MAKTKVLRVKDHQRELFDRIKSFYGFKSANALFHHLLFMGTLDIANLPEDKSWNKKQRRVWLYCRETAEQLGQTIAIMTAKKVLSREPSDAKLTIPELEEKVKEELNAQTKKAEESFGEHH